MNKLFGILLFGVLLFGCIGQPAQPQASGAAGTNLTKSAKYSDTVQVDYTLMLENGTMIETSIEKVAKENGLYTASKKYSPLSFQIKDTTALLPKFMNGIIGMEIGTTKLIIIPPEDGYGLFDPKKVYSVPLYYNMSRFENASRKFLESQGIKIEKDNVIKANDGIYISINDFDNETVMLEYLMSPGATFTFSGIPQLVVNSTNETVLLKYVFEVGKSYTTIGNSGSQTMINILEVNDSHALVDENHQLAGKTLYFNVTLRDIQ